MNIVNIAPALPGTRALFIDPDDNEPIIQDVLVWANIGVAEKFTPYISSVIGLTAMPHTMKLSDCVPYRDNFVGYLTDRDTSTDIRAKVSHFIELRDEQKKNEFAEE